MDQKKLGSISMGSIRSLRSLEVVGAMVSANDLSNDICLSFMIFDPVMIYSPLNGETSVNNPVTVEET